MHIPAVLTGLALLALASPGTTRGQSAPPSRPNVLVVCIDTLRADHLGCYGYPRATSPNLDRLAARGARFARTWSTSTWTLPSVTSALSGLVPARHRAVHFLARPSPEAWLLAQILEQRGYQTAGVVGNHFLLPDFRLDRGFGTYDGECLVDRQGINSDCIADRAVRWLTEEARPGFFLYLHFFDPHYDYHEHPGFTFGGADTERVWSGQDIWDLRAALPALDDQDRERLVSLYDSEVAFTDHHVGRVLDALDAAGFAGNTWVIVTADHGEALGEHGWVGHTVQAFEEVVRVPLIIAGPGVVPGVRDAPAQLVDLVPTLLDVLGSTTPPYGLDGTSLLPTLTGRDVPAAPRDVRFAVTTEYVPTDRRREDIQPKRMIEDGVWRLFVDVAEDGSESYRLFKTDEPDKKRKKKVEEFPERVAAMRALIATEHAARLAAFDQEEAQRQVMVRRLRGLVRWPWKLLLDEVTGTAALYDLAADPHETRDLAAAEPERVAALRAELAAAATRDQERALAAAPPLGDEELAALRARLGAMGYTNK